MMNPPGEQSPFSALQTTGCFVLARTLLFVDTVPDTWEPSFHGSGALGYFRKFQFFDATERDMWFAFLTLILRLGMSSFSQWTTLKFRPLLGWRPFC
jgi:hypothetical protein